jgi:hypothetical protein
MKTKKILEEVKQQKMQRADNLKAKYSDPLIHERLINREIWLGETRQMLIDSIGQPLDIDTKVTKTKNIEILKYNQVRANSFGTKITIENGVVIGWDVK